MKNTNTLSLLLFPFFILIQTVAIKPLPIQKKMEIATDPPSYSSNCNKIDYMSDNSSVVGFATDGSCFVNGRLNGQLEKRYIRDGKKLGTFKYRKIVNSRFKKQLQKIDRDRTVCMDFLSSGKGFLASSGEDILFKFGLQREYPLNTFLPSGFNNPKTVLTIRAAQGLKGGSCLVSNGDYGVQEFDIASAKEISEDLDWIFSVPIRQIVTNQSKDHYILLTYDGIFGIFRHLPKSANKTSNKELLFKTRLPFLPSHISISDDGKYALLATYASSEIRLLDVQQKRLYSPFEDDGLISGGLCFVGNKQFVRAASDGSVWLWTIDKKKPIRKLYKGKEPLLNLDAIRQNNDQISIVGGYWSGNFLILNGNDDPKLIDSKNNAIVGVEISPDGSGVLTAHLNRKIVYWAADENNYRSKTQYLLEKDKELFLTSKIRQETATYRELEGVLFRRRSIRALAFSSDSKRLVSGHYDRVVRVWDIETLELIQELIGHNGVVTDVAFSPIDHNIIISTALDGFTKVWNVKSGNELKSFGDSKNYPTSIAFSSNGKKIALHLVSNERNSPSSYSCTFTFPTMIPTDTVPSPYESDKFVFFYPDQRLGVSNYKNQIFTPDKRKMISATNYLLFSNSIYSKSNIASSNNFSGSLLVLDLNKKSQYEIEGHPGSAIIGIGISPDGRTLYSIACDGEYKQWDMETKSIVKILSIE